MAFEQGNDIRLSIGEILIGGQQGCSLNKETETTDSTTKDSGVWKESEPTGLSWSIDCNGLIVVDDEGLEALEDAWENMQQIDVKYGSATRFKTGKAIECIKDLFVEGYDYETVLKNEFNKLWLQKTNRPHGRFFL